MAQRDSTFGTRAVAVEDLDTTRGVAETLGISHVYVSAWVKLGLLSYIRMGNAVVVSISDVRELRDRSAARSYALDERQAG